MRLLIRCLLGWTEDTARYFDALAPLLARVTVGWVFLWSGWGKLHNLPLVTKNFVDWGVPYPELLTPFVSGVEYVGGILLLVGLLTRISAAALGITMIVAIRAALWSDIDSFETLAGFIESAYLAIFFWLAVAGPGIISIDHWALRWARASH